MHRLFRSSPARLGLLAFSLFLTVSLVSRLLLLIAARHDIDWNLSLAAAFATGIGFDAAAAVFAALPWFLLGAVAPARFLKSRAGQWTVTGLMTLFAAVLIFITTAEWVFWDEFGARFNFIAVDYLIWTQEVLGNIAESYPMVPIIGGIIAASGIVTWGMARTGLFAWAADGSTRWGHRIALPVAGLAIATLAAFGVNQQSMPAFANNYNRELAKNGCWSFFAAFRSMEIDYRKWYAVLPQDQAIHDAKQLLVTTDAPASSPEPEDLHRSISGRTPERRWNVILVCMESMSGDLMSYLGKNTGLTPNLDRLAKESVFFENLYATGTRTVRGMEALTLGLPPTPGQAIIYRPDGINLTTTFSPFLDRGYDCAFLYGGDGRFDFMNRYFSTSGCRIVDAGAWKKEDTTFKTAWGACDEDLFNKAIEQADVSHAEGKPFHFFCMTTSNHRPFTFPAGRIDMPANGKRKPAVKFADWAIGHLIEQASKRPWFNDTLFVIVADHCASSAGKAELDVTKYHIPAMIYNPTLVNPKAVTTLASQIDVMPTLFGLLGWNHETLGYGHDLLGPSAADRPGRAFVSNYQKLGLLTRDGLAILGPNRKSAAHSCDLQTGDLSQPGPAAGSLIHDATVFYQSASWLYNSGRLRKDFPKTRALASAPTTNQTPAIPTPAKPES
jgi:phosphoglycerol transferase MdoB-like AlkP superfamily enzyme